MAEYIERGVLVKAISKIEAAGVFTASFKNSVLKIISEQPAADVAEVRHGKWIRHEKDGAIFADYECSICSAYPTGSIISYYCPNCGAKMD